MLPPFPAAAVPLMVSDRMRAKGVSLRWATAEDLPFLRELYAGFRASELLLAPWPAAHKRAFTDDQFRLQHLHFTQHYPGADFWVVVQALALGMPRPIGRLYLERGTRLWRIVDIGFLADAQGQGLGSAMLTWVQACAAAAEAAAVELHVAVNNPRAHALYRRLGFEDVGPPGETHQPMAWRIS